MTIDESITYLLEHRTWLLEPPTYPRCEKLVEAIGMGVDALQLQKQMEDDLK